MRCILFAFALLTPGMGLAATACSFETECFEAEACGDAAFLFEFSDNGGGARLQQGLSASTEFEDMGGYVVRADQTSVSYAFEGSGATYFLTVAGDDARLSVHMEGPVVATYLGVCER